MNLCNVCQYQTSLSLTHLLLLANGPYFEQAVRVMSRTVCEAEQSRNYNLLVRPARHACVGSCFFQRNAHFRVFFSLQQYQSIRNSVVAKFGRLSVGESMASGAVKTAIDIGAKVIVVFSQTGRMASYIAKFRPCVSCLMVTPDLVSARQASGLLLGTHTVQVDSLEETEQLIEETCHELVEAGDLEVGDTIVVVAGRKAGMREQLRIVEVMGGRSYGHFVKDAIEHVGDNDGEGGGSFHYNREMILKFGQSIRGGV